MGLVLHGALNAPYPDNPADMGSVEWLQARAAMREASAEIERLRSCLEHTRDEICEGPVDDVLWHTAVPACTTVDNITIALNDGWTYDGWLQARRHHAGRKE